MKKVLTIVGPTAVGKTALSIALAKKYNAEIISGDSIQVYKGLDIGSGKVTTEEMQGVKHYLIDTLEATDHYSVADFQTNARNAIEEITNINKLPMIVGGTGLYVKACLYDYHFEHNEDNEELIKQYERFTNEQLMEQLIQVDNESAAAIHINNRKRLIRALVIAQTQSKNKSENEKEQAHTPVYDALIIGCTMERDQLYQRINQRVQTMVDSGLEEEIKGLLNKGVKFTDQAMQGIGYREWEAYFLGNMDLDTVIRNIQSDSRKFAKRQYTWFNNQLNVKWIDCSKDNYLNEACELIEGWLNNE